MNKLSLLVSIVLFAFVTLVPEITSAQNEKISLEEIRNTCKNTPFDQRVRISVARFSVSTRDAQGRFGDELATMLSNALQQTNCFRVLESIKNAEDMGGELGFGNSGMTQGGSSPQTGKMLGAQVVVTGEVTEYNEGKSNATLAGLSLGSDKARVGFVMKLVNPQTREILFSRSINVLGKKNGFRGMKLFGVNVAGGNSQNQAISNAVEHAILEAVSVLVENKDNIPLPDASAGLAGSKVYNRNNCALLASGNPPSIMVIIPEIHIQRRIPDPAGETEIIRKFIEAGFRVVDPSVYANIRNSERIQAAANDASQAQRLGKEYGADIIIIGEAFSERAANQGNMISCRARVEARAVSTKDATIIAANGMHAGGADITESSSSKVSLANAGALIGDYFLERMCGSTNSSSANNNSFGGNSGSSSTSIQVGKIDFNTFRKIQTVLESNSKVSNVTKKFSGKDASFDVNHSGTTDDILEVLMGAGMGLEVKSYSDGKIVLSGK